MPMIDVYAADGTFDDTHTLAQDLASAVMRWGQVPDLALFRNNTAAFIHELPASAIANVNGDSNYVRVQVLTPAGMLDRDKQLGVVKELTEIVSGAAGDPGVLSGPGCCSPSRPKAVGAWPDTPILVPTSRRRPARNSQRKRKPGSQPRGKETDELNHRCW
jgi:hypothetical protein